MAEENVLQKIIRLILDKTAAKETEDQSKTVTEKIDAQWKSIAKNIAGYLGVAFLTKKILDFGKASVEEAMNSEAAWSDLAGTIDATGASFDGLEESLRATADAFQDATIHDDDAFATSLSRVISLTGDVQASTNNMGLIANVAAKFFKGDLAPATDLVAKAMNGNTAALGKMGIQAKSAQEALDILATRSMGAAEKQAGTFAGKVAQLGNAWGDFKKGVGEAIIQSDGASSAFDVLRAAVETLSNWVDQNKKAIGEWVTKGVKFAIDAADVLYRAIVGVARILTGGFQTSLGIAAKGLGLLTNAIAFSVEGWSKLLTLMGAEETGKDLEAFSAKIYESADAITAWADAAIKAGSEQVAKGIDTLSNRAFSSGDFDGKTGKAKTAKLNVPAPMVGMNAELSDAQKAWEKFDAAIDKAKGTISGTGAEIKYLEAQASALSTLMDDLTKAGVKPADESMKFLKDSLRQVNGEIEEAKRLETLNQDLKDFADNATAAELTANPFATNLQRLTSESSRLTSEIQKLISDGMDPLDEAMVTRVERLKEVQELINAETEAMQFQQQVAGELAQALFASFGGGLGPYARMKAKQNYLEATESGIRAVLAALTGFGALHAGKYAAAAAQHAALGAAWSALAASVGGGGGGGGAPTAGGGGSPGGGLASARSSSSTQATKYKAPEPITEIHFVGPGFDALNPKVQKVVIGAQQQAIERVGANANIRVIRSNS